MSETTPKNTHRTRKIAAIAAGLLVVGVGATYTLASWTDSEWVWGGTDGDGAGVGTSQFEVQQDASSPFVGPAGTFDDFETNPGDNLTFSAGALSLTPGDTIYAPVALRTTATSVSGDVTLQPAVAASGITINDPTGLLWNALRVTVYTATGDATDGTPPSVCGPGFDSTDWDGIVAGAPLATLANASQVLAATAGSTQHYCFEITLPADSPDTLQGRTVAPAWEFKSVSN